MIAIIWAILKTSRLAQIALAATIGLAALTANNAYQRSVGAKRATAAIVEATKEAGKAANEEATKAHTAAARPGAADRLRKFHCRDC